MRRGEIWFADFDPVQGSEIGGIRPALVIQNDRGNKNSPTVIVAAITFRMKRPEMPTHTVIKKPFGKYNVVQLEQIRTLDKNRLKYRADVLEPEEMERVDKAIKSSLGLT